MKRNHPRYRGPNVKPEKWGSDLDVRKAVIEYFENKVGVPYSKVLYFPFWEKSGRFKEVISGEQSNNIPNWVIKDGVTGVDTAVVGGSTVPNIGIPFQSTNKGSYFSLMGSVHNYSSPNVIAIGGVCAYRLDNVDSGSLKYNMVFYGRADHRSSTVYVGNEAFSCAAVSGGPSTFIRYFHKGALVNQLSTSGMVSTTDTALKIGNTGSNSNPFNGLLFICRDFLASDKQIGLWHENPYAAIQPRSWPSYFFIGGGAAPSTYFMPQFMNHKFIPSFTGGRQ